MTTRHKFEKFHREHPEVFELLTQFAYEKKAAGWQHYGVKGVIERARWELDNQDIHDDAGFKINNSFAPYYARLVMSTFPDLEGFFRLRASRADAPDFEWVNDLVQAVEGQAHE